MGKELDPESLSFIESIYKYRDIPLNTSSFIVKSDPHISNSFTDSNREFSFCDNSIRSDSSCRQATARDQEVTTT